MLSGIKSAILGSFVGDSMALGTHWVYDQDIIEKEYGRVDKLLKPELVEYHALRDKGDFTHYGDQAYELLIELNAENEFDLNKYASRFRALFKGDYKGYIDKATQKTLDLIAVCPDYNECRSHSNDLGGVSRIAPLLSIYAADLSNLKLAVESFVQYTHDDLKVKETAAFFAELSHRILIDNLSPLQAMTQMLETNRFANIACDIKDGIASMHKDTNIAILEFGMSCSINGALASTIHLIAKYEDNFNEAIISNVMAGGDSAARGMLVGMILGAHLGLEVINPEWLLGMKKYDEIIGLIDHTRHMHYYDNVA